MIGDYSIMNSVNAAGLIKVRMSIVTYFSSTSCPSGVGYSSSSYSSLCQHFFDYSINAINAAFFFISILD